MKKPAVALIALTLVASGPGAALVATPSLAASSMAGALATCSSPGERDSKWNFAMMAGELNYYGIKYESINRFGGCFLVRVENSDGSVTNQFYDPATLALVYEQTWD